MLISLELADLQSFFKVETEAIDADSLQRQRQQIWIRLRLPIVQRTVDPKTGKETVNAGNFQLSLRLKLNSTTEKQEEQAKAEEQSPEEAVQESAPETISPPSATTEPYLITEFSFENVPEDWWSDKFEADLRRILQRLIDANLSLVAVIEDFYYSIEEELNYPHKEVILRDFFYPIFDDRHWGRFPQNERHGNGENEASTLLLSPSSMNVSYRARALYDFQALMQGELSFQENDILQVFANLGNGWLTARKINGADSNGNNNNNNSGLIPENYIERL